MSSVKSGSNQSIEELVQVIQDVLNMAGDENAQDKVFDGMDNAIDEQVYLPSIIIDILWLLDQDESLSEEERERLYEIGRSLLDKKLINSGTATERLEPEFLQAIQVIPDAKAFDKKIVRTKTNLLYKQTKFNLLREESEGYSKLCVEMVEHLVQPLDYYWSADKAEKKITHQDLAKIRMADIECKTKILMENITCLIGYFDMDPIRVLDVILDGFIAQCLDYWDFYVCLLKKSPWRPIDGIPKKVVSQILGFKFRFYTRIDQAGNTPVQLYWTAAVLIREGIVALDDLYSHLDPEDDKLKNEFFEYMSNLQTRASKAGRFAATKMTGSLDDGGSTSLVIEEEKKTDDVIVPKNQKAGLLKAISALGDIKHTRIILDRVSTLSKVHADIADNICRILHVVVEDLDKPLRPFANISRKEPPSIHEFPPPVSSFNSRLTPNFERIATGKKHYPPQYKFFYDNWRDQAPRPSNFAGLLKVLRALLPYIGAHLYRDVLLTGKLIRLGRKHVKESIDDETVKNSWLSIISQFLFPALSQMPSNPSLAHELWMFVKLWPYSVRYALYGEWKRETYEKIPELAVASAGCRKDIQYIMNRLSKDNIKTYGRLIGKIVHSNPTIAFSYILNAIESYDNMIPFVVEATRYLTALEFDILSFCLIEALARESKIRIERNGTTIEKWLKSLSNFSGTLFAKYKIELDGILKYLANQLISDQVYDLIVLQDLITSMSGISPPEDATAAQLDCMAGGEVIRRESMAADSNSVRKPTYRLVQSLFKTGLALPLGALLAQQTKEIGFRLGNEDPSPDLKVIAWLNDQCQKSFLQYFEFLENNAGAARYAKFCPTLTELIKKYGVDLCASFHIIRPHLSNLMKKGSVVQVKNSDPAVSPDSTDGVGAEMDVDEVGERVQDLPSPLSDISNQVANLGVKKDLPLTFYVTFWQLGLSDVTVPHSRYEMEIKKKEETIIALDKETGRGASKRKKEKERLQTVIQELKQEWASQKASYVKTQERLQIEKEGWFAQLDVPRSEIVNQILQNCIIPRSMFSAGDALYCAKFLDMLHELGTANLSIVSLYDRIFNRDSLHAIVFSLTESEAKNFGAFLCLCLQKLTYWHSRKSVYDKHALASGRPGFLIKFPDSAISADDLSNLKMFEYEDFRSAMHKWHLKMRKCFLQCLSSGDYMQLRNGMIILNKISEYFPLIDYMGRELELSVSKIEKKEERADVKQMARSYYANLRRRKSFWIPTSKFCNQLKPVSTEDEVTESVGDSSVADITENVANDVINEDAVIESGEVRAESSEMDVDETSILEQNVVSNSGPESLEIEDSVKRIVSVIDVGESSSQEVKRPEDLHIRSEGSGDSRASSKLNSPKNRDSDEKTQRNDMRKLDSDRNSNAERSEPNNRKTSDDRSRKNNQWADDRRRDEHQRDFDRRDDSPKDPIRREDRNQKRDELQKDLKRDDRNQRRDDSHRDLRRDDRFQRRDDREFSRKDDANREFSKRDENFNRGGRTDDRNTKRDEASRNYDDRGKDRSNDRLNSKNDRSNLRKNDDRDDRGAKRSLPDESSSGREDGRPEQRPRRDNDRPQSNDNSTPQSAKPLTDIVDKIRQISREEKDRLLLARIDMEKRSLEQSKQAAQTNSQTPPVDNHNVNIAPASNDNLSANIQKGLADDSNPSSEKRIEGTSSRPRFERPLRSTSKPPPERTEEKKVEQEITQEGNRPIRDDSNKSNESKVNEAIETSNQEIKEDTPAKDQDYNKRNDILKKSNRESQDSKGKRDDIRNDAGNREYQREDYNRRGNFRSNDRRGESHGNRGGRSNSGQDRRSDDYNQRKSGNQQQYNRGGQRTRDDSKRGSDERDRNDAKRFKIVR